MSVKTRKPKLYNTLLCMLFAFFIFLTFYLNFSNGSESKQQSSFFLDIFNHIFNFLLPNRSLNIEEIDGLHYVIRKFIGHFMLFSIDGVLTFFVFNMFSKKNFKYTIIFGVVFAFICEFMQLMAGGRSFALLDICLDFFSFILVPMIIYIYFAHKIVNEVNENGIN